MSQERWQCLECGTFNPNFHPVSCSLQTPEQKIERLTEIVKTLENMVQGWRNHARRSHEAIVGWHGRYAIVKHENNQLRRKLQKNGSNKLAEVQAMCRDALHQEETSQGEREMAEAILALLEGPT